MGIKQEREVARADMNDECGVSVWQEKKLLDFTVEEARAHAGEILAAAEEAERIRGEMDAVHASSGGYPYLQTESGEPAL